MPLARSLMPGNEIDAAISRVLEAERESRLALEAAQASAAECVERARAAVRVLDDRTEQRIRKLRAAFAAATERRIDALEQQARLASDVPALSAADQQSVGEAVGTMAALLTRPES